MRSTSKIDTGSQKCCRPLPLWPHQKKVCNLPIPNWDTTLCHEKHDNSNVWVSMFESKSWTKEISLNSPNPLFKLTDMPHKSNNLSDASMFRRAWSIPLLPQRHDNKLDNKPTGQR